METTQLNNHVVAAVQNNPPKKPKKKKSVIKYASSKKHCQSYIGKDVKFVLPHENGLDTDVFQNGYYFYERLLNSDYLERKRVLCSRNKKTDWLSRPIEDGAFYSYIRVNPTEVVYYIIIDVDNSTQSELLSRFKRLGIYPSFMIGTPEREDSWHLFFGLKETEYRNNHLVERCKTALTLLFYGDTSYTNMFARNPLSPSWQDYTYYFDIANYDLANLKDRVDVAIKSLSSIEAQAFHKCSAQLSSHGKALKFMEETSSGSRNVDTFRHLLYFSRLFCEKSLINETLLSHELKNIKQKLYNHLMVKVKSIESVTNGLPLSEIKQIVKSVSKYHTEMYFSGKFDVKIFGEQHAKQDETLMKMFSNQQIVDKLDIRIPLDQYKEWAQQYQCTVHQIKYYIRLMRANYGISFAKNKERVEDMVWYMKNAEKQSIEQDNLTHFDVIRLKSEQKRITALNRKRRAELRKLGYQTYFTHYDYNDLMVKYNELMQKQKEKQSIINKIYSYRSYLTLNIQLFDLEVKQLNEIVEILKQERSIVVDTKLNKKDKRSKLKRLYTKFIIKYLDDDDISKRYSNMHKQSLLTMI